MSTHQKVLLSFEEFTRLKDIEERFQIVNAELTELKQHLGNTNLKHLNLILHQFLSFYKYFIIKFLFQALHRNQTSRNQNKKHKQEQEHVIPFHLKSSIPLWT